MPSKETLTTLNPLHKELHQHNRRRSKRMHGTC